MIYGNKEGVRESVLVTLESLYELEIPDDRFVTDELLAILAQCTEAIRREISVYISRHGTILDVVIGDAHTVGLKNIHLRRNTDRLSMVRDIHTHPGGDSTLSQADLSALRSLRLDAMSAVGVVDGAAVSLQTAFLAPGVEGEDELILSRQTACDRIPHRRWLDQIEESDRALLARPRTRETAAELERAVLVGIEDEESLQELRKLAETAGARVVGQMLQRKSRPDTATFLGSGKVDELALACQTSFADLVIFDDELSGVQLRNLEEALGGVRVLDRTALILDIFAQRAESKEGRLQVELAQMSYQLPRLTGHGVSMSRLGGGIGTRGPGETRLEMDRRRIRKRIYELRQETEALGRQRALRRSRRERSQIPVVALVGYTNAGKTTLLNALSGASAHAQDQLFATLDPLMRQVSLPNKKEFVLVDTVGFIRKLPHALVDAFRSTLEETIQADLLLIVSDGSSPRVAQQHEVVLSVLEEMGAQDKPRIDVMNKADQMPQDAFFPVPNALAISAKTGEGLDALMERITSALGLEETCLSVLVPYDQGATGAMLYQSGRVIGVEYEEEGTRYRVYADAALEERLRALLGEARIGRADGREGD